MATDVSTQVRRWHEFHEANPEFWRAFRDATDELMRRGVEHYSALAIVYHIRYERARRTGEQWRVSNNCAPFYSRMYTAKYPSKRAFFEQRPSQFDGAV